MVLVPALELKKGLVFFKILVLVIRSIVIMAEILIEWPIVSLSEIRSAGGSCLVWYR